ncbi:MAG: FkbM family methyltransferase [Candidatus Nanohaloarchaea archaeon]
MKLSRLIAKVYEHVYPHTKSLRGATFLKRIIEKKIKSQKIAQIELLDGTKIFAPLTTDQAYNLYLDKEIPELEQLSYLKDRLREGETFVDVGASFGLFSCFVAENTSADIVAFEPRPSNTAFLTLNNFFYDRGIEIFEKACSDETGKTEFHLSKNTGGMNSLEERDTSERVIEVETVELKRVVSEADVVKIDVEGAEFQVLKGMHEMLDDNQPEILLELHKEELLQLFGTSKQEVLDYLHGKGYEIKKNFSQNSEGLGNHLLLKPD